MGTSDSVRVVVRARPLLPSEKAARAKSAVRVGRGGVVVAGADRAFTFDSAFGEQSVQQEVYDACVAPLVESCFAGYNSTVLCYGQARVESFAVCAALTRPADGQRQDVHDGHEQQRVERG